MFCFVFFFFASQSKLLRSSQLIPRWVGGSCLYLSCQLRCVPPARAHARLRRCEMHGDGGWVRAAVQSCAEHFQFWKEKKKSNDALRDICWEAVLVKRLQQLFKGAWFRCLTRYLFTRGRSGVLQRLAAVVNVLQLLLVWLYFSAVAAWNSF